MPGLLLLFVLAALPAAAQPNIVLILADDLGWRDVGFHGAEWKTPHIDRIASEGVDVDRFYAAPICSPTRAGLLTGRYPLRSGIQRITVKSWGTRHLALDEVLIPQALAGAGYETRAMVGKWHLGWTRRAHHPMSRGFTSFYGLGGGAVDYFEHKTLGGLDWHRGWEISHDEGYATTLLGQEAVRVIDQAESPFFLYVAFNAVHTPNDVLPEYWDRFAHIPDEKRRAKAAMTASLDDEVGRILDALDRKNVADDTLVWFFSDNGGAVPSGSVNLPLRDGKWAVYEGGIRTVSALRWPNGVPGGRKLTEPVSYIDVFPTLLAAAGVDSHDGPPFDGENVLDVIQGERTRDDWVFHSYFQGQRIPTAGHERNAVIDGKWKLVRLGPNLREVDDPHAGATLELYDVEADPYEERDLAAQHPEIVRRLADSMTEFRKLQIKDVQPVTIRPPAGFQPPAEWRIPQT